MLLKQNLILALIGLCCVQGCGAGNGSPAVSGRVQFADGAPVTIGSVTFDSGTYSSFSTLTADGAFSVYEGLPPGNYRVSLTAATGTYDNPTPVVAKKYATLDSSDLTLTVDGPRNDVVLTVDRPK